MAGDRSPRRNKKKQRDDDSDEDRSPRRDRSRGQYYGGSEDESGDERRRGRSKSPRGRRSASDDGYGTTRTEKGTGRGYDDDEDKKSDREAGSDREEKRRSRSENPRQSRNRSPSQKKHVNTENKKNLDMISRLQKKIKRFKKKHLGPGTEFDYEACHRCIQEDILPQWMMAPGHVKDAEEFLGLTLRKPTDEEVMDSDEFMDLVAIAHRAQAFEILVPEVKRKVSYRLTTHVFKSCKSLKEECGEEVIVTVHDYDDNTNKYYSQIETKEKQIDEEFAEYKDLTKPFPEFVRIGRHHSGTMSEICNKMLEMCKAVETWVKEDDDYPNKLMDEFRSNKKKKENMKDAIAMHQEKMKDNQEELQRVRRSEGKSGKAYFESKRDKEKLRARQRELWDRQDVIEEKIARKQDERDDLKEERQEKGPKMSQSGSDDFLERLEAVERSIERLERERKSTEKQLQRVERDMKPTTDRAYEAKVDHAENRNRRWELENNTRERKREIEETKERMAAIDAQNETIRMIREMKLSPEAFRKCQREKRRRQAMESDGTKALADAIKYAAPSIAGDWKKLYLCLPFDPPRDREKRQKDVANLDYFCSRSDVTEDEQALKSLNKWRSFHRRGNVSELVYSLRQIRKKKAIANEIERKFGARTA